MSGALHAQLKAERGNFVLDIELSVEPGETVALLGPNGAGKSTTLEALMGWQRITSGSIELGGRVLDDPASAVFVEPERRAIGVAFQDKLLFPHLSAIDNVAFGVVSQGHSKGESRRMVRELVEALGLTSVADRPADELSGGQAQRVALGRALAINPELLLLDEPMAALDVTTRTAIRRLLRERLVAVEAPTILVTHDPTDASVLADRIIVIEDGKVTQVGTPAEIRRRPQTTYAADLVGINLITGTLRDGTISLDADVVATPDVVTLSTSDRATEGRVVATVHPRAVALHREQPDGSPRNAWMATVESIEPLGETSRVQLGAPLPLTADITPAATEDLGLAPGRSIWVAIKATEISVSNV